MFIGMINQFSSMIIQSNLFVGVTPASALSFFGDSIGKKMQTPSRSDGNYRLVVINESTILNLFNSSLPQSFVAGGVAGITNTIVLTPVERVKCLLQVIIKR